MGLASMLDRESQQDDFAAPVLDLDNRRFIGYVFGAPDPSAFEQNRIGVSRHDMSGKTRLGIPQVAIFFIRLIDKFESLGPGEVSGYPFWTAVANRMISIDPDAKDRTGAEEFLRGFSGQDIANRDIEMLNRKIARAVNTDQCPTGPHEIL